jgi:hypothetical protein
MHLAEFRLLIASRRDDVQKKGELKMKASPTMLLKTNGEKMSLFGYATMSMKTNDLNC